MVAPLCAASRFGGLRSGGFLSMTPLAPAHAMVRCALLVTTMGIVGPASADSGIGYTSVSEALAALRAEAGAQVAERGGWTLVTESVGGDHVLWSFTPALHPAHPAVVKRRVFQSEGVVRMEMDVLCEAARARCDQLTLDFRELNRRMSEAIRQRQPPKGATQ